MRAVAHGLLGDKNYVECPTRCGGPNATLSRLDPETRALRLRVGCDAPCEDPWYAIVCPSCNGTRVGRDGETCRDPDCYAEGEHRGRKAMRRCPGSFQTYDIARALRAWTRLKAHNSWPVEGGTMEQCASFLLFLDEIESAVAEATPDKE